MVDTEPEDDFKLVCKAFREKEIVLWAGAGLSAYAGYPVGTAFARILAEELGEVPSKEEPSLPDIAERYQSVMGREALLNKIREVFSKEPTDVETHRLLSLIKDIPYIVTTNYDCLFEAAYGDDMITIVSEQELSKTSDHRRGDKKPLLFKPHGDVNHLEEIVITRKDYDQFDVKSLLWTRISTLPAEYPIIFIGYSLKDENIRSLLDNILKRLGSQGRSYIIIAKKTETDDWEWYKKHNVKWIEKDAVEAVREITDYVTQHSFVDSHNDITQMYLSEFMFRDRNLDIPMTIEKGLIRALSVRPVNPDNPFVIKGNLRLSVAGGSQYLKRLDDVRQGRTFDPVEICGHDSRAKMEISVNGVYLIDPNGPTLDHVTITPHPNEEKIVDLQVGADQRRISNVQLKRFVSDTDGRVIFVTPWFDLTINLDKATQGGDLSLKIHHFTDIEKGLEIYSFFKAWVDGGSILVIPSDSEKPWEIPPLLQKEPSMCDVIQFWHQIHQDLSDIQRAAYVRLQLPEEVTNDECQVIADAAALIRGERHITGEIKMHVLPQAQDAAKILTDKPVDFECSSPHFKESFEIFGVPISLSVVVGGRGVVPSNIKEALAEAAKGAETVIVRYDGSVGELYQRYIPRSLQTDKEEMKTS